MDYVVSRNQQIAVSADSPDQAVEKALAGQGNVISTNYSAQPRPQPQISGLGGMTTAAPARAPVTATTGGGT